MCVDAAWGGGEDAAVIGGADRETDCGGWWSQAEVEWRDGPSRVPRAWTHLPRRGLIFLRDNLKPVLPQILAICHTFCLVYWYNFYIEISVLSNQSTVCLLRHIIYAVYILRFMHALEFCCAVQVQGRRYAKDTGPLARMVPNMSRGE